MIDPAWLAAYGGLGLVVGFVAGLLGVGGGLIIVPVLIMMLHAQGLAAGMEPQLALGTSLASILFTSLSSVHAHHRHGAVEWPLVRRIAPGIVLGTLIGAMLAAQMSAWVLKVFFVAFLFYAAIQMWLDFKPVRRWRAASSAQCLAGWALAAAPCRCHSCCGTTSRCTGRLPLLRRLAFRLRLPAHWAMCWGAGK